MKMKFVCRECNAPCFLETTSYLYPRRCPWDRKRVEWFDIKDAPAECSGEGSHVAQQAEDCQPE